VHEVTLCIFTRDDIQYLIHIEHDPVSRCSGVVVPMSPDEELDLGKSLLDQVEVGRVRWEELDSHTESICKGKDFVVVMDPGVVQDKDAKRTRIRTAFWHL
jgi:hypothetical protein